MDGLNIDAMDQRVEELKVMLAPLLTPQGTEALNELIELKIILALEPYQLRLNASGNKRLGMLSLKPLNLLKQE